MFLCVLKKLCVIFFQQGLIGGEIITYLEKASQKHALNPENIFAQMIQVTLARYFKILFEWLTHCSVDCDILHEVIKKIIIQ